MKSYKESFSNWRDEIVEGKDKDEKNESFVLEREDSPYEKASDKALDKKYGYGTSHDKGPKTGFGRSSNRNTAAAVLKDLRRRRSKSTPETRADAAHKGWSHTARTSADQTPEKKATRKKLADTPYKKLPKDEQEKDQVAADAVKKEYEGRKKKEQNKIEENVSSGRAKKAKLSPISQRITQSQVDSMRNRIQQQRREVEKEEERKRWRRHLKQQQQDALKRTGNINPRGAGHKRNPNQSEEELDDLRQRAAKLKGKK